MIQIHNDAATVQIYLKRLSPSAVVPSAATDGSNGYDLHATENFYLYPGDRKAVPIGWAVQIPRGYVGLVCPRSGLALKKGVTVINGPGVIDSDYRGEVKVLLLNTSLDLAYEGNFGDKVAQLLVIPVPKLVFTETSELDATSRTGGFGSTGN